MIVIIIITGSDPDKCLFLWENLCNLGYFFLLGSGFRGQKLRFKDFVIMVDRGFLIVVMGVKYPVSSKAEAKFWGCGCFIFCFCRRSANFEFVNLKMNQNQLYSLLPRLNYLHKRLLQFAHPQKAAFYL